MSNYSKYYERTNTDTANYDKIDIAPEINGVIYKHMGWSENICNEPSIAHAVILDLVDRVVYSNGLQREITLNVLGEPAGEEMRLQILYDMLLILKPTPEELEMIQQILAQDQELAQQEADEEYGDAMDDLNFE